MRDDDLGVLVFLTSAYVLQLASCLVVAPWCGGVCRELSGAVGVLALAHDHSVDPAPASSRVNLFACRRYGALQTKARGKGPSSEIETVSQVTGGSFGCDKSLFFR